MIFSSADTSPSPLSIPYPSFPLSQSVLPGGCPPPFLPPSLPPSLLRAMPRWMSVCVCPFVWPSVPLLEVGVVGKGIDVLLDHFVAELVLLLWRKGEVGRDIAMERGKEYGQGEQEEREEEREGWRERAKRWRAMKQQ